MEDNDLRIEADPEDLKALKEALYAAVPEVDLQEDAERKTGQHGEGLLIGLVIALGGVELTREVLKTIRHWMDKRVQLGKIGAVTMYMQRADGSRQVTLENLMKDIG